MGVREEGSTDGVREIVDKQFLEARPESFLAQAQKLLQISIHSNTAIARGESDIQMDESSSIERTLLLLRFKCTLRANFCRNPNWQAVLTWVFEAAGKKYVF